VFFFFFSAFAQSLHQSFQIKVSNFDETIGFEEHLISSEWIKNVFETASIFVRADGVVSLIEDT